MNRIDQLKKFLEEDPDDPFNVYALALEYLKSDHQKAHDFFQSLLSKHAEYLPTYYPFAHLLIELQKPEEAALIFQRGIDMARRVNDSKTLKELSAAYNDWLYN